MSALLLLAGLAVEAMASPPAMPVMERVLTCERARRVIWAPDSQRLAVVCGDDTVRVLEADTWRERAKVPVLKAPDFVRFTPDSAHLGVIVDGRLRVYSAETGAEEPLGLGQALLIGTSSRDGLALTNTHLFESHGRGLRVYALGQEEAVYESEDVALAGCDLLALAAGDTVAAWGCNWDLAGPSALKVWRWSGWRFSSQVLAERVGAVGAGAWSDGRALWTYKGRALGEAWPAARTAPASARLERVVEVGPEGHPRVCSPGAGCVQVGAGFSVLGASRFTLSPDGETLVMHSDMGAVVAVEVPSETVASARAVDDDAYCVDHMVHSKDYLATWCGERGALVLRTLEGAVINVQLDDPGGASIYFDGDSDRLVLQGEAGAKLYSLPDLALLREFRGFLAAQPDGRLYAPMGESHALDEDFGATVPHPEPIGELVSECAETTTVLDVREDLWVVLCDRELRVWTPALGWRGHAMEGARRLLRHTTSPSGEWVAVHFELGLRVSKVGVANLGMGTWETWFARGDGPMAFLDDERLAMVSSERSQLTIHDIHSGTPMGMYSMQTVHPRAIEAVGANTVWVGGDQNSYLERVDLNTGASRVVEPTFRRTRYASLSEEERGVVAAGDEQGGVQLWDVDKTTLLQRTALRAEPIELVSLSSAAGVVAVVQAGEVVVMDRRELGILWSDRVRASSLRGAHGRSWKHAPEEVHRLWIQGETLLVVVRHDGALVTDEVDGGARGLFSWTVQRWSAREGEFLGQVSFLLAEEPYGLTADGVPMTRPLDGPLFLGRHGPTAQTVSREPHAVRAVFGLGERVLPLEGPTAATYLRDGRLLIASEQGLDLWNVQAGNHLGRMGSWSDGEWYGVSPQGVVGNKERVEVLALGPVGGGQEDRVTSFVRAWGLQLGGLTVGLLSAWFVFNLLGLRLQRTRQAASGDGPGAR